MFKIEEIVKLPTPVQRWENPLFESMGVNVFVKRDDLIHPVWGGNKFRKLKYNLAQAQMEGYDNILSFGGAFSNHLYAMAGVAGTGDFKVRMIIRGEELTPNSSPTLQFAQKMGVELIFVSRSAYREKDILTKQYGTGFFNVPEGGSNALCLSGVSEMVDEVLAEICPTHFLAACGSGGTLAGILSNENYAGKVIGVPVLKNGSFLSKEIKELNENSKEFTLWLDYHFGGYARYSQDLLNFMDEVELSNGFQLDQVYTAKLFYALYDQILKGYFEKGDNILVYHSGGLQGAIKKGLSK